MGQEYRKLATGSMVEVTQAGAAEWRAKSDAEKQRWASNYEAEKAEYAEAMKKYKESRGRKPHTRRRWASWRRRRS
ncbi:unnamed protein product [Effrenium voratum]|nr:unnamed protein product [Effrenium voratum]